MLRVRINLEKPFVLSSPLMNPYPTTSTRIFDSPILWVMIMINCVTKNIYVLDGTKENTA